MIEELPAGIWRVGGGAWGLRDLPVLSDPRDGNVYLVRLPGGYALVDCGSLAGLPSIEENIRRLGIAPGAVTDLLLTHSHGDHTGSAAAWKDRCGVRTHLGAVGAEYLDRQDHRLLGGSGPFAVDHRVTDGERFDVAGSAVVSVSVPGHSPDCTLYLLEIDGKRVGFGGDVCFAPADWDPEPGIVGALGGGWKSNLEDYRSSLEKILRIPLDFLLPGHGFGVSSEAEVSRIEAAALATIERFLATPKIYSFWLD